MVRGDFPSAASEASRLTDSKSMAPAVTLDSEIFADLNVKVTAILGHGSLSVRSILDLSDGSVLDLDTPLDGLIDIAINGRIVAQGEIVAVDDKFGVRIKKIIAEYK